MRRKFKRSALAIITVLAYLVFTFSIFIYNDGKFMAAKRNFQCQIARIRKHRKEAVHRLLVYNDELERVSFQLVALEAGEGGNSQSTDSEEGRNTLGRVPNSRCRTGRRRIKFRIRIHGACVAVAPLNSPEKPVSERERLVERLGLIKYRIRAIRNGIAILNDMERDLKSKLKRAVYDNQDDPKLKVLFPYVIIGLPLLIYIASSTIRRMIQFEADNFKSQFNKELWATAILAGCSAISILEFLNYPKVLERCAKSRRR